MRSQFLFATYYSIEVSIKQMATDKKWDLIIRVHIMCSEYSDTCYFIGNHNLRCKHDSSCLSAHNDRQHQ